MPNILMKCPKTNMYAPTGVSAEADAYRTGTFRNMITECQQCGQMHAWRETEVVLDS